MGTLAIGYDDLVKHSICGGSNETDMTGEASKELPEKENVEIKNEVSKHTLKLLLTQIEVIEVWNW